LNGAPGGRGFSPKGFFKALGLKTKKTRGGGLGDFFFFFFLGFFLGFFSGRGFGGGKPLFEGENELRGGRGYGFFPLFFFPGGFFAIVFPFLKRKTGGEKGGPFKKKKKTRGEKQPQNKGDAKVRAAQLFSRGGENQKIMFFFFWKFWKKKWGPLFETPPAGVGMILGGKSGGGKPNPLFFPGTGFFKSFALNGKVPRGAGPPLLNVWGDFTPGAPPRGAFFFLETNKGVFFSQKNWLGSPNFFFFPGGFFPP